MSLYCIISPFLFLMTLGALSFCQFTSKYKDFIQSWY